MNFLLKQFAPFLFTCGLAIAEDSPTGLSCDEALKLCRTMDCKESGKYWFNHGEKESPYHHAGRLILSPGGRASYAVADADGTLSEVGLDVPDDAAELHARLAQDHGIATKPTASMVLCWSFPLKPSTKGGTSGSATP